MDGETERKLAALILAEAERLRLQAAEEGVRAYLNPKVRVRPNAKFLKATVQGVQQANRISDVSEMWKIREQELREEEEKKKRDSSRGVFDRAGVGAGHWNDKEGRRGGPEIKRGLHRCLGRQGGKSAEVTPRSALVSRGGFGDDRGGQSEERENARHERVERHVSSHGEMMARERLEDQEPGARRLKAWELEAREMDFRGHDAREVDAREVDVRGPGGRGVHLAERSSEEDVVDGVCLRSQSDDAETKGMDDDEIEEFLKARRKRGRGAIGSRMDETGPYPAPTNGVEALLSRVREEWEERAAGSVGVGWPSSKEMDERGRGDRGQEMEESEQHEGRRKKRSRKESRRDKWKVRREKPEGEDERAERPKKKRRRKEDDTKRKKRSHKREKRKEKRASA